MNHEALPTAEDDYVERLFKVMRGYDCFFPFSDEDLRGMIRDWLRAAADLSMDVLGRLDGLTFYLHEDVNSLEDDDPVRLVFPMSIGNNVYGHRASQGDNGICHDENAAPPAAGQASAVRELVAVVRDHVADLRRCVPILRAFPDGSLELTATEFAKAASELELALADAAPVDREQDERGCCPVCHETDRITSTRVPEHRREYVVHGEECTDHMPAMRDCHCLNCDAKWIMPESQDDFR